MKRRATTESHIDGESSQKITCRQNPKNSREHFHRINRVSTNDRRSEEILRLVHRVAMRNAAATYAHSYSMAEGLAAER